MGASDPKCIHTLPVKNVQHTFCITAECYRSYEAVNTLVRVLSNQQHIFKLYHFIFNLIAVYERLSRTDIIKAQVKGNLNVVDMIE